MTTTANTITAPFSVSDSIHTTFTARCTYCLGNTKWYTRYGTEIKPWERWNKYRHLSGNDMHWEEEFPFVISGGSLGEEEMKLVLVNRENRAPGCDLAFKCEEDAKSFQNVLAFNGISQVFIHRFGMLWMCKRAGKAANYTIHVELRTRKSDGCDPYAYVARVYAVENGVERTLYQRVSKSDVEAFQKANKVKKISDALKLIAPWHVSSHRRFWGGDNAAEGGVGCYEMWAWQHK